MKKLTALFLTLIIVLSLTACGGSQSGTSGAQTQSTPADGTAKAGDTILVGCLQDITGPTSALGMSVEAGAKAAVEEINANGGVDGRQIVMKTYDTKGDVTEAVNAYITAVTVDNVAFIVGPPVANIANAIKETSEGYDVPVVGLAMDPACQLKEDGTPYKNMFCFQPDANAQEQIMASFALENGYKSFGILYNQENSYSVSLLTPFVDELASNGITIPEDLIISYGAADMDYKTLLSPIVNAGVDAIYCPNYTQQLISICAAAKELGFEGKIINGLDAAPSFITIYGDDCSNIYFINNINLDDEKTAARVAEISDTVAAANKYFLGYDIVKAVIGCFEKVGFEDMDALRSAITEIEYTGMTGTIHMNADTHMPKDCKMFMYTYDYQTPVMISEYGVD